MALILSVHLSCKVLKFVVVRRLFRVVSNESELPAVGAVCGSAFFVFAVSGMQLDFDNAVRVLGSCSVRIFAILSLVPWLGILGSLAEIGICSESIGKQLQPFQFADSPPPTSPMPKRPSHSRLSRA